MARTIKEVNMSLVCDSILECPGWEKSYSKLKEIIDEGKPYTGESFIFCPWCGKMVNYNMWDRDWI